MIAVVPGYISRSVAGSYDNEGIAIFCMLFTYYLWIKAIKTGAIYWSALCALAYFYMVGFMCFIFKGRNPQFYYNILNLFSKLDAFLKFYKLKRFLLA